MNSHPAGDCRHSGLIVLSRSAAMVSCGHAFDERAFDPLNSACANAKSCGDLPYALGAPWSFQGVKDSFFDPGAKFLCKEAAPESSYCSSLSGDGSETRPGLLSLTGARAPAIVSTLHYRRGRGWLQHVHESVSCVLCQHESGYWRDCRRDGKFVCHSPGMSWRIKHIARYYALNSERTRVQSEKFHSIDRGNGRPRLGSSSATLQRRI